MKLLDQRTIQSNLNEQRRVDIDNGVKLAQKVDVVRNILVEEEAKLSHFREVTVKTVQTEIDSKVKERDILVSKIAVLEQERIELLKPLDKEWALVKEAQNEIKEKEKEIDALKQKLVADNEKISKKLRDFAIEEKRQADTKAEAQKRVEQASGILVEAKNRLSNALEEGKRVEVLVRTKTREMDDREAVLRATIGDIERREQKIEDEKQFINEEKIKLADQRGVLERAMARIQK